MTVVAQGTKVSIDETIRQRLATNTMSPCEAEDRVRDLFPEDSLVVAQQIPDGSKHPMRGYLEIQVVRRTDVGVVTARHYVKK